MKKNEIINFFLYISLLVNLRNDVRIYLPQLLVNRNHTYNVVLALMFEL